jgi:selenide, water dikinase
LAQVLRYLPAASYDDPRVLVGAGTFDDAGVYRLTEELALVQTVDYFTPVVDDPYDWGRVAAANALSDIYAMGAKPLTALNLLNFPVGRLDLRVAAEVLRGGLDKIHEAGAVLLGGHSVHDPEPKYGLAVTGLVHPDRVVTNAGARPGDCLVLTKPIGIGIVTTAVKRGLLAGPAVREVTELMAALNRPGAEAMAEVGVHAATDVTGFGLLGHLWEMAQAGGIGLEIQASAVPLLEATLPALAQGALPGGSVANREHLECQEAVTFEADVAEEMRAVLTDANTSGGLVIAVPQARCEALVRALGHHQAWSVAVIGRVVEAHPGRIHVRM